MRHVPWLLAIALLIAACGADGGQLDDGSAEAGETGGETAVEADATTVRVGALYPTSGDIAAAGTNTLNGVQLAVDVLNGNRPHVDIRPLQNTRIELVASDTQGDPQIAVSEVDRLVRNEDVAAIIGAYQSNVSLTASERAERLKVPFVNGASGAGDLSDRGLEWWFRTGPTSRDMAKTYFQWLNQLPDEESVERVAVIHMNDAFGNDFAAEISQEAGRNEIEVVESIRFEPGATDLTSQVQRLRSADPDAIFATMFIRDTDLFLATMEELGYTPPALLAAGGGWDDPTFVDVVGDLGQFNIRAVPWGLQLTEENKVADAVASEFENEFGVAMNGDSARTFTAMIALGRALEAAESTEPEAIRDALRATDITETIMPWEGIKFDDRGQNVGGGYLVLQLDGATWEAVYPREIATADVVWPMPPFGER